MPWDRVWAIAHEAARVAPGSADWAPCANFSRGAKSPELMAIRARVDEAAGRVTLTHPRREPLTVDPDDPEDAARLVAWVTPLAESRPGAAGLRGARAASGMTDSAFPSISVLNRASLAALGDRLGAPLAMERFRGNVWLDGLAPFAEFDLVGRDLRLGDAVLRVRERITRCKATTVDPATGISDADTLGGAARRLGPPGLRRLRRGHSAAAASPSATRRRWRYEAGLRRARRPRIRRRSRRPQALRRPGDFLKGVIAMDGLPPADRLGGLLRRPLQRRQVEPDQRADRPQGAGPRLEHARAAPRRSTSSRSATAHYLVDLPGYGFAEAPKPVVERWQALMRAYLAGRPTLRRAFLLIDARHGLKPVDAEIMALLDRSAVTFQAVLTKADKPGAGALAAALAASAEALARHPAAFPEIIVTSAETGRGLETFRAAIAALG